MDSHDGREPGRQWTEVPLPSPRPGPAPGLTLASHVSGGKKVENSVYEAQKAQDQGFTGVCLLFLREPGCLFRSPPAPGSPCLGFCPPGCCLL